VSHTAVVENKRLSHALTIIKAQQDVKREPKVQTNSEKIGYKKKPRQLYGPNYKPKSAVAPAVETARRLRRIMMTEPLCRISDSIALQQHADYQPLMGVESQTNGPLFEKRNMGLRAARAWARPSF
jgi:hypothetical protein